MKFSVISGLLMIASIGCVAPADAPTSFASDAPTEQTGETQEDLFGRVKCSEGELGAPCENKCGLAGMWCPSGYTHPYNPGLGTGQLWQCASVPSRSECWYYYDNGSTCVSRLINGRRTPPLCSFLGDP